MMGARASAQLATIVADASAGDEVAFARIVDAHHKSSLATCGRSTGEGRSAK
jgi:hypothetical protein